MAYRISTKTTRSHFNLLVVLSLRQMTACGTDSRVSNRILLIEIGTSTKRAKNLFSAIQTVAIQEIWALLGEENTELDCLLRILDYWG